MVIFRFPRKIRQGNSDDMMDSEGAGEAGEICFVSAARVVFETVTVLVSYPATQDLHPQIIGFSCLA